MVLSCWSQAGVSPVCCRVARCSCCGVLGIDDGLTECPLGNTVRIYSVITWSVGSRTPHEELLAAWISCGLSPVAASTQSLTILMKHGACTLKLVRCLVSSAFSCVITNHLREKQLQVGQKVNRRHPKSAAVQAGPLRSPNKCSSQWPIHLVGTTSLSRG